MPDQSMFQFDACLSGRCVCRTLTEALLAKRNVSDVENGKWEQRRIDELTSEAMRLFGVADTVLTPHASATEQA